MVRVWVASFGLLGAVALTSCGGDGAADVDESCGARLAAQPGLGVLLAPADAALPDGAAALLGVDVRTGETLLRCPLPVGWRMPGPGTSDPLPMSQAGVDYPAGPVPDAVIGTQWISRDLRWVAGPGRPLGRIRAGSAAAADLDGQVVAVGTDLGLVRRSGSIGSGQGWCTVDLAAVERGDSTCAPLPDPGVPGGYVLDGTGRPLWIDSLAVPIRLGDETGYAITDGARLLRVERAGASRPARPALVSADGRTVVVPESSAWFTVAGVRGGVVETTAHRAGEAPTGPHTAFAGDGGRTLVLGLVDGSSTRFVVLREGSGFGAEDSPVRCAAWCRVLAWPGG